MLKVSLILTTYNCLENLKGTLKSIASQDYPNLEIIIADGLSTDGTLEYIQTFSEESSFPVVWQSEKDYGIYDAMNKGYALSTGEIIAFFNDTFTKSNSISLLIKEIETHPDCIGVHSDLVYMQNDIIKRYWRMGDGEIIKGWMPAHPTLFLKKEVYQKYGIFNTGYICSADYEFMVRILGNTGNKLAYVPETLISMYYGGTSTGGFKNYIVSLKEAHHALVTNQIPHPFKIDFLRIIKFVQQFFI